MLSPARAIALVAALSVLFGSTGARAQDAGVRAQDGGAAQMGDRDVELRLVGPDDPALRDSIRELLARLHLSVASAGATIGGSSSRVASVQIDLSSPSEALLTVTDGATGEARLRRSVPRDASAAIVREEIAHAVQSAVEAALLAARERAAAPPSPPPPAPAPVVPIPPPLLVSRPARDELRAPPSPYGLEVATLAGVSPIADASGLVTRIGVGASLVSRVFLHPSLALEFLYAIPFDTGDLELSAHTSIASLRALPGIGLFHGRWLAVDLGAGGGVDIITVDPHSAWLPPSTVNGSTTSFDRILSAMLTAHVALSAGVIVLVSAGADMDLDSRQYVLAQGTSLSPVLEPWRFRPMLLAGFGFAALGDGLFPLGGGH